MNKLLLSFALLVSALLMALVLWVVLYTPPAVVAQKEVLQAQVHQENDVIDVMEEFEKIEIKTTGQSKHKAEISIDAPIVKKQSCIINRTDEFETDLKPCDSIQSLKFKKLGHIQNLIVTEPFELIQAGVTYSNIDESGDQIESPSHIQVEKIGVSELDDIYILPGYEYVFPASEYSYEQTIEYDELWVERGEHIQIYLDDPVKKYDAISGVRELVEYDELIPCPEVHESEVVVVGNEFIIKSPICTEKNDLEKIGQQVVKFSDIELEKCINRSLGRSTKLEIKQYHLNHLANLKCISPRVKSLDGISKIPNLKALSLNIKNIENLSEINNLTNLEVLSLRNADSVDINDLLKLDQLVYLKLEKVNVKNLNAIGGLTNLKSLFLINNNILDTSFLVNVGAIENLSLKENDIINFGYYPILALKFLELSQNNVSSVEKIAQYSDLAELRIEDANLVNIDALHGLPKLRILNVRNNQISQASIFENNNKKLRELNLIKNPIDCELTPLKALSFVSLSCN